MVGRRPGGGREFVREWRVVRSRPAGGGRRGSALYPEWWHTDRVDPLCIDRGEGATYQVGDSIVVCVTAFIPQATAVPPPAPPGPPSLMPLPLVQVVNVVNDGPEHVIFAEAFAGGQRCLTFSIVPPTGSELLRVTVVDQQNGRLIATDEVRFTSVGS